MLRVNIGNFPEKASAVLKIKYYKQLEVEDLSYALRIPMVYIPKYMGDMRKFIDTGKAQQGEGDVEMADEEEKEEKKKAIEDVEMAKQDLTYYWNLTIHIKAASKLTRVVSMNHKVITDIKAGECEAEIKLSHKERKLLPTKDFLLLFRDETVGQPIALKAKNDLHENVYLVNFLADYRTEKQK